MYELMGRTVLITGASSGIGEAVARLAAREGARLLLCARRYHLLENLAEELKAAHDAETHCFPLDVGSREAVQAAFGRLPPEWREIDALVNNAGLSRGLEPIQRGSLDDWDEMIRANVQGLLYVSRAVIPGMVERRRGDIVNIGSISGHEVYPKGAVYCATKHAVDALTKGMRLDLMETPIRVCQISPGMVETEFSKVRFHGDAARARKVYEGLQPLRAEDIADAVLYVLTRPAHVQIAEFTVLPTSQAGANHVHRDLTRIVEEESTWRSSHYDLSDVEDD